MLKTLLVLSGEGLQPLCVVAPDILRQGRPDDFQHLAGRLELCTGVVLADEVPEQLVCDVQDSAPPSAPLPGGRPAAATDTAAGGSITRDVFAAAASRTRIARARCIRRPAPSLMALSASWCRC